MRSQQRDNAQRADDLREFVRTAASKFRSSDLVLRSQGLEATSSDEAQHFLSLNMNWYLASLKNRKEISQAS
jgi:hypothetical protein